MATIDLPLAPVPDRPSIKNLHEAMRDCRACDLWEGATQPVMGEGARHAHLMLVGEQPGDRGRPVDSDLAELVTLTTHPSAILRAEDADREDAMALFIDDLKGVAQWLSER